MSFQPAITLRPQFHRGRQRGVIRWGLMPDGKERALGGVALVSIEESLGIYRAALHRKRIEPDGVVQVEYEDGRKEVRNWAGGVVSGGEQ